MNAIALLRSLLLLSALIISTQWARFGSAAETSSSPTVKPIMRSRVFQWDNMKPKPSAIGLSRDAFDHPTATLEKYHCHITTLDPGKEPHPAHQHPEEELIIIKEGTLQVVQNSATNNVEAGGMIFCASDELHGWRNASARPVTYYVIKVYPRDLKK